MISRVRASGRPCWNIFAFVSGNNSEPITGYTVDEAERKKEAIIFLEDVVTDFVACFYCAKVYISTIKISK